MSPEQKARKQLEEESRERHAAFRAAEGWKRLTYEDPAVLALGAGARTRVVVSLDDQRALLLKGDMVAMDFPVASGKRGHPTPKGSFTVLSKQKHYSSNLYGKVLDAEGRVVDSNADRRKAEIPEGGRFVGSPMPFWIRLTNDGVGLHVGHLPGRPASHGCVRMPRAAAAKVFDAVEVGTPVEIVALFTPAAPPPKKKS